MRHVLIVGAGPAGLAAAAAARRGGARVTLLDASDQTGGQFWRHLPPTRPSRAEASLHHRWSTFAALRTSLERDPDCRIECSAQVWAIDRQGIAHDDAQQRRSGPSDHSPADPDHALTVHVAIGEPDGPGRSMVALGCDALVIATGAHDWTLPFPGWDLPGVFTAGGAQAMAKGERIAVGRRVMVAGAGPFLLPVTAALLGAGSEVVGVHEASGSARLAAGWLGSRGALPALATKTSELVGHTVRLGRHRIPYHLGSAIVRAYGTDSLKAVTTARLDRDWRVRPGTERTFDVDAVAVSHGFVPRLEVAIAAGCRLTPARFVEVDARQQTSVDGVFAAGEVTGIAGADAALVEGEIAGHAAAVGGDGPEIARARRHHPRYVAFARSLEAAHGVQPGWTSWLTDDTIMCRCEEVTVRRIRSTAEATDAHGLRSLKLTTRAGLGVCQGRVCGRSLESMLAADGHPVTAEAAGLDRRPIVSPLRFYELAEPETSTLPEPAKSPPNTLKGIRNGRKEP